MTHRDAASRRDLIDADPCDAGFTLTEVLVSLALLVIVAVATAALVLNLIKASRSTQLRVTATNLAQQDLQQMRSKNNADHESEIDSATRTIAVGNSSYTLTRTVTICTPSTSALPDTCGANTTDCPVGRYRIVQTAVRPQQGGSITLSTRIAC